MAIRSKLAVILHADVVGSTALIQIDERVAHERIRNAFSTASRVISEYGGETRELRGDALLAEFQRASDAVTAALAVQAHNAELIQVLDDEIRPLIRIGLALGEVVIADGTITGPGVVMAQRLEQLAEPGGVCIQSSVRESVPKRFPFDFKTLGKQTLKGFEEPVRAHAVSLRSRGVIPAPEPVDVGISPTLELPDKPSIAVLPFANLSGDPEQDYFSDGITEDIITLLSKVSGLFVIGRSSSFAFKGQRPDFVELSKMLGVRYVLEGSVRRAGEKLRINARLLDAISGKHLWADRYDGDSSDVFDLQDRITESVVASLAVSLTRAEQNRALAKPIHVLKAYDYVLRGNACHHLMTMEDNVKAKEMYKQAILLDPNCAPAHAGLAWVLVHDFNQRWSDDSKSCMDAAFAHANAAVALDDGLAVAHLALGDVFLWTWRQDQAVTEGRRAIAIDPSYADGHFALAVFLIYAGHAEEAVLEAQKALRYNPVHAHRLCFTALARANFAAKNYEAAAEAAQQSLARGLTIDGRAVSARLLLAASFAELGRVDDAKRHFQEHIRLNPKFSLEEYAARRPYKNAADADHEVNALRQLS